VLGDLTLEVSIEGLDEAVKSLKPLEDIERSLSNILLETAMDMTTFAQNRIPHQSIQPTYQYEPLAESTKKARKRSGQSRRTYRLKRKVRMWPVDLRSRAKRRFGVWNSRRIQYFPSARRR